MVPGPALVGTTLLHYRIVDRLGSGGMGEVYLAEDTRLGRRVALKFLAAADATDPDARARLVREAQAASILRSPHIAVTYDLIELDHALFIAMEYVEGQSLSARLATGPLPVPVALDVALQVADALDEAHGHGIVHRDIKSANLIVTPRELVKVLDFGLAKILAPAPHDVHTVANLTMPGLVLGTLNYMAPEQLRGAAVDHRADLFSLGVVLYEMLTGRLPFTGDTLTEIADRILNHEPEALARYNYGVPSDVEAIVRKALEKPADFRYQSARELYVDLRNARRRLDGVSTHGSTVWHHGSPLGQASTSSLRVPVAPPRSLAVLAFANITRDASDDWIGQGIAETLTADLKKVQHLSVMPREQIFDQLRHLTTGGHLDERQAIEIGRRLGAGWVVSGAYQRIGERVRITAQAIEVASSRVAASLKVDGRIDELFDLQDRLVRDLAASLELHLGDSEIAAIAGGETSSIEAYEAYARGMLNLRLASRDSLDRAVTLFERAVAIDPQYAEALAGLGAAYQLKASFLSLRELNARGIDLLRQALALRPTLADARVRLGTGLLMEGDVDAAIAALQDAVRGQPDHSMAHGTLGRAYWVGRGLVPEAIAELELAVRLNPESGYAHLQLALLYALNDQAVEAEAAARAAIALQEQAMSGTQGLLIVGAHARLGYAFYRRGRHDEAIAEYRRELEYLAASDHALRDRTLIELQQKLSAAFFRKGDDEAAAVHGERAIRQFQARLATGADDAFTRYYMASLFGLRGDAEEAIGHLQKPLTELGPLTRWRIGRDADFDPVRPALAALGIAQVPGSDGAFAS
ncbi:MAG: protein kinase [Vicinamibacterales bacterium]|nr:protein kinase [Vicinamibacterales bacterium]